MGRAAFWPAIALGAVVLLGLAAATDDEEPGPGGGIAAIAEPARRALSAVPPEPEPNRTPANARGARCAAPIDGPCEIVASDTASDPDPEPFWGAAECDFDDEPAAESGASRPGGGDPGPTATGGPQGGDGFRLLTLFNGDDYFGERCELGRNDRRAKPNSVFYEEGDHIVTFVSVLLPPGFPVDTPNAFQGVLQMKQTQPADVGNDAPALALGAYQGRWQLFNSWRDAVTGEETGTVIWSTPAADGVWTRFAFDVVYSADPERGSLRLYADLDGDGAFSGPGELSPLFGDDEPISTLRPEIAEPAGEAEDSSEDGLAPGEPVPSHLRAGLYHDGAIPCPNGCSVGIDNVQIVRVRP